MPKVRVRKEAQEKAIEEYANKSNDPVKKNQKKQGRICISLLDEELEKIKELAEADGRSISSFIRVQLLKNINES